MSPPFQVHDIGEIAIRCFDINSMFEFYRDIIGLEVMSDARDEGIAFFKICNGFGGHTTVLALFLPDAGMENLHPHSDKQPVAGAASSLHHLALTVAFNEQGAIKNWLDQNSIEWQEQVFEWIGWCGIFLKDPEGNTIELVAADKSLLKTD